MFHPPTPIVILEPIETVAGHTSPPTINNIPLCSSQTLTDKTFCLQPLSSSQPLNTALKSSSRIPLRLNENQPHQKIDIEIVTEDGIMLHNAGFKTIVEDKENINIKLTDSTKILIIGDSNLRNTDANSFTPVWHIICIPGAKLDLISEIIKRLPTSLQLTDIIITGGICDSNTTQAPIGKCLTTIDRLKVRKHFLGLSWNRRILSSQQTNNLTHINTFAQHDDNTNYITPPLNISIKEDGYHLRPNSVKLITETLIKHMERFLCQVSQELNRN